MSDESHDQAAITRRAALRKLGIGTVAFIAPAVMTVSAAEAKSRGFRSHKSGKRSPRTKGTKRSKSSDDYDYNAIKSE